MIQAPTYPKTGEVMQITPRGVSIARHVDASISTSTEITLDSNTRFIRLYAVAQDVYLRWGIENVNVNTFDEIIPAGQIVDLAIPFDNQGSLYTAFNVIERVAGATVIVIEK